MDADRGPAGAGSSPSGIGVIISFVACLAGFCTPPAQRLKPEDVAYRRPGAISVVIVHSRSGNTAVLADVIAQKMNADYFRLEVPEGSGDHFLNAPNRHKVVPIRPAEIDLAPYSIVFLGSPIWYWNPTAFIYQFIRTNDLRGKKVVLFYTNEGGLSKTALQEWTQLVESRGGKVLDIIGINRKTLGAEPIEAAARRLVDEHSSKWREGRPAM